MKTFFQIALGLMLINAGAAVGRGEQGVELWDQVPPASPVLVLAKHNLFTEVVNDVNQRRDQIDKALAAALCRPDMIHKGVTLYKMNLKLGSASVKFNNSEVVQIDLPKNYCYFRSTTPTSLGKYADPALEVHFDVRLKVTLQLPTLQDPRLVVKKADISVPHIEIKPRNFVADVGVTVTNIVNFFVKELKGRDIIQTTFQKYLPVDVTKAIDSRVKPINDDIAKIVKEGFTPTAKLNGQQLVIILVNSKTAVVQESRKIEGEVLKRRSRSRASSTPATPPADKDQ
jgi:hypothetical protein